MQRWVLDVVSILAMANPLNPWVNMLSLFAHSVHGASPGVSSWFATCSWLMILQRIEMVITDIGIDEEFSHLRMLLETTFMCATITTIAFLFLRSVVNCGETHIAPPPPGIRGVLQFVAGLGLAAAGLWRVSELYTFISVRHLVPIYFEGKTTGIDNDIHSAALYAVALVAKLSHVFSCGYCTICGADYAFGSPTLVNQ